MDSSSPAGFILLGHPRCGSNLLFRALVEHPQIRIFNEVFAPKLVFQPGDPESNRIITWSRPPIPRYQMREDYADYLARNIFATPDDPQIRATGFKMFFDHARTPGSTAWDYLTSHDIRVVHLIRRNLLDVVISMEVAKRTKLWFLDAQKVSELPPPLPAFALAASVCESHFAEIVRFREWTGEAFAGHAILPVEYEDDLAAAFSATVERVHEFLGVTPIPAQPALVKQQQVPASRQVANYVELERHFRGTPYAHFFKGDPL